jgi:peptidylprolyl isomerase
MSKFTTAVAVVVVTVIGAGVFAGISSTVPAQCESPYSPGKASELVTAESSGQNAVVASFPTPLKTTGIEMSVIREGEGEPARARGFVDFDVSMFLGADGSFVIGSEYDPANPVRRPVEPGSDVFFADVLQCALPGSQLVVTATAEEVFGPIQEDATLQNASTLVLIVDVHGTYLPKADGAPRLPQSGLPTIVQTADGVHGLSFPTSPAPRELRVSVLRQGDGEAIARGDYVTAHLTGAVWETRQIFITSFEGVLPLLFVADNFLESSTGEGVAPGLADALIGRTVGSQILVSIPPELGYPPGLQPPGVSDGQTTVYVLDILGTRN